MTIINVTLDTSQPHARVSVTNDKRQSVIKRVPVASIPELFTKASVNGLKEADTGFISPYLIRECVANGQVKRLYMIPEVSFTGMFQFGDCLPIKEGNKYGITSIEQPDPDDEDDSRYFVRFPDFKLKNFGALIVNTNNSEFSNVTHNYGIVSTNLFNMPTNESKLLSMLCNHFDHNVCWHGSFDRDQLKAKDTYKQVNTIHAYLNSNFNSDLRIRNQVKSSFVSEHREGFKEFLIEILDASVDNIDYYIRTIVEHQQEWYFNIITLYYFCSVRGFKFDDIYEQSSSDGAIDIGRHF